MSGMEELEEEQISQKYRQDRGQRERVKVGYKLNVKVVPNERALLSEIIGKEMYFNYNQFLIPNLSIIGVEFIHYNL